MRNLSTPQCFSLRCCCTLSVWHKMIGSCCLLHASQNCLLPSLTMFIFHVYEPVLHGALELAIAAPTHGPRIWWVEVESVVVLAVSVIQVHASKAFADACLVSLENDRVIFLELCMPLICKRLVVLCTNWLYCGQYKDAHVHLVTRAGCFVVAVTLK